MKSAVGVVICVTAIGLLSRRSEGAPEASGPARLTYLAPSSCPGEAVFRGALDARLAARRTAAAPVALEIDLTAAQGEFVGALTVTRDGRSAPPREVRGRQCEDVVSALAFLAAVALDLEPEPIAPPPKDRPPVETGFTPSRLRPAVGAIAVLDGLSGPGMKLGVLPVVDLEWDRKEILSPLLRAGVWFVSGGADHVSIARTAAAIDLSPLRFQPIEALSLRPCAGIQLGQVRASGLDVNDAQRANALWAAVSVSGHVEVAVPGPFRLTGDAGAAFPLTRLRLYADPQATLYRFPGVGAQLGIGVAARLP